MKPAPDFALLDQTGTTRKLSDYRGTWVIVYFYPKDDTPGCTTEACEFRDSYDDMTEAGIQIIGISKDSVVSHKKFAEKYQLNFPILSDPDHQAIEAFGAWGMKKFMGREFEGTIRQTYLINPEGQIVKEYPKVTPKGHVLMILKDYRELSAS